MVLHAHRRHLLDGRSKLFHMASDHHGVVAGIETPNRIIERDIRGQGDELIPFPGFYVAHGLEAVCHTHVHVATGDRFPRLLKANAAGRPTTLHPVARFRHQPEVILHHDAGHELAGEVIGKIGGYRAIGDLCESGEIQTDVGNRIIVSFFDNGLKGLVRAGLGEFGNASRYRIDRSHVVLLI